MVVGQETHPGTGAGAAPPEFRDAVATHARRPAAPRDLLRGDARAAADRAVRLGPLGRRHRRRHRRRAPAGSSCCTTRPATTPGTAPSAASPTPAPRSTLELVTDPMLAAVGWSWLTEALSAHGASYAAESGTVTRVATESFGGMADEGGTAQIEIRASWTPLQPDDAPDAGPLDLARTSRPGASCCAPRSGCRRSPRGHRDAEPPRPAGLGTLSMTLTRPETPTDRRPPSPRLPLLTLRDGLPPVVDTARGPAPRLCADLPPAPARSRSTPSGPPATATPRAPT